MAGWGRWSREEREAQRIRREDEKKVLDSCVSVGGVVLNTLASHLKDAAKNPQAGVARGIQEISQWITPTGETKYWTTVSESMKNGLPQVSYHLSSVRNKTFYPDQSNVEPQHLLTTFDKLGSVPLESVLRQREQSIRWKNRYYRFFYCPFDLPQSKGSLEEWVRYFSPNAKVVDYQRGKNFSISERMFVTWNFGQLAVLRDVPVSKEGESFRVFVGTRGGLPDFIGGSRASVLQPMEMASLLPAAR